MNEGLVSSEAALRSEKSEDDGDREEKLDDVTKPVILSHLSFR